MQVSAKTKEKPTPVTVDYPTLTEKASVAELVQHFGEEVVAASARGAIVISLQAFMRRHIDKGADQAAIQAAVQNWKPDVRTIVKQTAFEKAASSIDKLSPQERAELLKKLRASLSAAA